MKAKFIGGISHGMYMDINPDVQVVKIPEPLSGVCSVEAMNKPCTATFHPYKIWKRMAKAGSHPRDDLLLYVPYSWTDEQVIAALVGF